MSAERRGVLASMRDEVVEAWAYGDHAAATVLGLLFCTIAALVATVTVLIVLLLIHGLPYTLIVVPVVWGFVIFMRGVARDAAAKAPHEGPGK